MNLTKIKMLFITSVNFTSSEVLDNNHKVQKNIKNQNLVIEVVSSILLLISGYIFYNKFYSK